MNFIPVRQYIPGDSPIKYFEPTCSAAKAMEELKKDYRIYTFLGLSSDKKFQTCLSPTIYLNPTLG